MGRLLLGFKNLIWIYVWVLWFITVPLGKFGFILGLLSGFLDVSITIYRLKRLRILFCNLFLAVNLHQYLSNSSYSWWLFASFNRVQLYNCPVSINQKVFFYFYKLKAFMFHFLCTRLNYLSLFLFQFFGKW